MLQFLSLKRFVPVHAVTTLSVDTAEPAAVAADTPESIPRGCGWFDSSFDLRFGLMVQELPGSRAARQIAGPSPIQ